MNAFTKEKETKMHKLANGFAKERVDSLLDNVKEIVAAPYDEEGAREKAMKQLLGRMLATAYVKGYADADEGVSQKTLIVPGGFRS